MREDSSATKADLKVFISNRESVCDECGEVLGRVGHSAAAKELDAEAVSLAVRAHVRHVETEYDLLLISGHNRVEARAEVADRVDEVMAEWARRR